MCSDFRSTGEDQEHYCELHRNRETREASNKYDSNRFDPNSIPLQPRDDSQEIPVTSSQELSTPRLSAKTDCKYQLHYFDLSSI